MFGNLHHSTYIDCLINDLIAKDQTCPASSESGLTKNLSGAFHMHLPKHFGMLIIRTFCNSGQKKFEPLQCLFC